MNMLIRTTFKFISSLALIATLPALTTADTFVNELSETFDTSPGEFLVVKVDSGNVDISSVPGDQLKASILMSVKAKTEEIADKAFDSIEAVIERTEDGDLLVKAKHTKKKSSSWLNFKSAPRVKIAVTIQCPENYNMNVDTGSGNIKIREVSGDLSFDTGSGSIIGKSLAGKIVADTGSGNIDMTTVEGRIVGDTGSGNIIVRDLSGSFSGDTGSGNIKAFGSFSHFKADTGSGNISIQSDTALSDDSKADAGSGNISVKLPGDSSFMLKAQTSSGKIHNDFPVTEVISKGKRHLNAKINDGGPRVIADSGSGNVSISSSL